MPRLVIGGARVFDGTGADIRAADIAIEDGRIAEVGPGLVGDERVDGAGTTVLPGLFDCHVHVMITSIDIWRLAQMSLSYRYFEAARNLADTLAGGITTIRDGGGADLGLKQAVDDGLIVGPRMHIAVGMISQTGGHSDYQMPSGLRFGLLPEGPGYRRRSSTALRRCDASCASCCGAARTSSRSPSRVVSCPLATIRAR